jgi:hypothetical protein
MSTRRLKGLDAIRDATVESAPALHVLNIGDIPCGALTVREAAEFTRLPAHWIRARIREGRIRVISESLREYVIPLAEIPKILDWAEYVNTA